jgi:hypothetical protein
MRNLTVISVSLEIAKTGDVELLNPEHLRSPMNPPLDPRTSTVPLAFDNVQLEYD